MNSRRQFLTFLAISGFAAAVNFCVRFPIDYFTSFEAAVVFAYMLAMTTAFLLNRRFTFNATAHSWRQQYWRFFIVNMIALAQVFLVTVGLARIAFPAMGFHWHEEAVAHAIGLASPVLTSYLGHKHFSFAGPDVGAEQRQN